MHKQRDPMGTAIGLGGVGLGLALAIINLFGSRMNGIDSSGFFWVYLSVLGYLAAEDVDPAASGQESGAATRSRRRERRPSKPFLAAKKS